MWSLDSIVPPRCTQQASISPVTRRFMADLWWNRQPCYGQPCYGQPCYGQPCYFIRQLTGTAIVIVLFHLFKWENMCFIKLNMCSLWQNVKMSWNRKLHISKGTDLVERPMTFPIHFVIVSKLCNHFRGQFSLHCMIHEKITAKFVINNFPPTNAILIITQFIWHSTRAVVNKPGGWEITLFMTC